MYANISNNSCCSNELIRNHQLEDRKRMRIGSLREKRLLTGAKDLMIVHSRHKKPIKRESSTIKQVFAAALTVALSIALISDLSRILKSSSSPSLSSSTATTRNEKDGTSSFGDDSGPKHAAWASWIGAVPTAAELYGDAASEMPTTESFDDDEDDEELDASASNEYPDNDNEADESYEDPDEADQDSEQESRKNEHWIKPIEGVMKLTQNSNSNKKEKTPAQQVGGHAVWSDLEGWRRNKRDLEDRILLASRRAAIKRRADNKVNEIDGLNVDEFNVDDGDEDNWVNDGIDDIHIDPETKKAASELSMDEKSIDAEYDPHQKPDESKIVNRTRVTTIAEVIPMNVASDFGDGPEDKDSTRINSRFLSPPLSSQVATMLPLKATEPIRATSTLSTMLPTESYHLIPASHLSIHQAQELVAQQAEPRFWSSSSNIRASILPAPKMIDDDGSLYRDHNQDGRRLVRQSVVSLTNGAESSSSPSPTDGATDYP